VKIAMPGGRVDERRPPNIANVEFRLIRISHDAVVGAQIHAHRMLVLSTQTRDHRGQRSAESCSAPDPYIRSRSAHL